MAFWSTNFTDPSQRREGEPKRVYRFKVTMNGISDGSIGGSTNVLWAIKDIKKPSFKVTSVKHSYLNHTFNYPGRVEWEPVSLNLVDPVNPDMVATFASIIRGSGYRPPARINHLDTISKSKAASSLGMVKIEQFNAEGEPLETWKLWNAFITDFNLGDLKYEGDELSTIALTLTYDWASLEATKKGSIARVDRNANHFWELNKDWKER